MEKEENPPPESSQLVEPPLNQRKLEEAVQENLPVQEEKEDNQASFTSLGTWRTISLPGRFTAFRVSEPSSTTPLFGASSSFGSSICRSSAFGSSSTSFGGMAEPVQDLLKLLKKEEMATLLINASVTDPGLEQKIRELAMEKKQKVVEKEDDQRNEDDSSMCRSTSSGGSLGFGQKPTGVWKHLDAVSKRKYLEAAQTEEKTRLYPGSGPFLLMSHPAITEEDGQTAKLESILSAMPAYNYERYESCFAIAGADYCVVAVDSTRGHTRISKLSEKSVMASCGFQADVKALQEALAAENSTYEREHNKPMSCPEMHRLFRNIHKLHPNYVFIVLGGLDSEGKGCAYQLFGPGVATIASGVGHPGSRQIEPPPFPPILKYKSPAKDVLARMSETEAVRLAETVFRSATKTGDKLEIAILNASGLRRVSVDLRKDCP